MKSISATILFLFLTISVFSQGITGRVVDISTGEPIESATVISETQATLTNRDGEYILTDASGHIEFSHVSYYSQSYALDKIPSVVQLSPRALKLENIEVKAKTSLSSRIRDVYDKYKVIARDIFRYGSINSTYYYRQTTMTDSVYTEYLESFFSGYRMLYINSLSLREGRYAAVPSDTYDGISLNNHYVFSQLYPITIKTTGKVPQVPLSYNYEKSYKISYVKSINPDSDDEIRIYRFEPRPPFPKNTPVIYGDLYVRNRDNAIIQFDGFCDNFVILFPNPQYLHMEMSIVFVIKYKDVEGLSYPIVESVATSADLYYQKFHKDKSTSKPINAKIESIMFVADLDIRGDRSEIKKSALLQTIQKSSYDPKFWEDNPIIKRTEIEEQIIRDFTKSGYFGNFKIE